MPARVLLASLLAVCLPIEAHSQGWSVDLSAGRIVYDPASVNVATNSLVGTVRYDAPRGVWVYGASAPPLRDGETLWGAFGAGGRFLPSGRSETRRVDVGADVGAHGFLFRDAVTVQTGRGVTFEAIPFASVAAGAGRVEFRGGWRGHSLSYGGVTQQRSVFETGARVSYGSDVRLQGDVRWVHASEGMYPFAGGTLAVGNEPFRVWAQAGKWLSDELSDAAWGVGASMALGGQATLWTAVQQEAPDPLYWNASRRTWSVGVTRRLGAGAIPLAPAPRAEDGAVWVRVEAADAPGTQLSIAGDFNKWQPVPMRRQGSEWVIRLRLAPGVYHYAFRSAGGEWFVPPSVAGRRDDGMGGHVAVLVVP